MVSLIKLGLSDLNYTTRIPQFTNQFKIALLRVLDPH